MKYGTLKFNYRLGIFLLWHGISVTVRLPGLTADYAATDAGLAAI